MRYRNATFLFSLKDFFSKITPSLFTLKEGSTSHPDHLQWSLHPLRFPHLWGTETSGAREKTALQCYICPTCPSPAGGSLTHSQALALSKRARDVTAPSRCSEPLRSKVGGASKPSPDIVRDGTAWGKVETIWDGLAIMGG